MELALDIHSPIIHGSPKAQETVCKVLGRIQKSWDFTNVEMARLLHIRPNTYGNWINANKVPLGVPPWSPDIEAVISLMAIHRSLSAMFNLPDDQVIWLKTPHPDFRQESPLNYAKASCAGLFYLKAYLDYIRGRGA